MTKKLGSGVRVAAKKGAPAGAAVGGATSIIVGITEIYGPELAMIACAIVTGFVWLQNGGALDVRRILWIGGLVKSPVPRRRDGDRDG